MFNINEVIGCIIKLDHSINMADMQDTDLTNLKLQKLLYYTQGHFLAEFKSPLFINDFYAWQHGPVISDIYHKFKHNGSELIDSNIGDQSTYNCLNLTNDKQVFGLIERVMKYYNQYSPWKLRDMTHEETPWKTVALGDVISQESMKDFFSQEFIKTRI